MDLPPSVNDPGTWSPQRQRLIWVLAFIVVLGLAWAFWLSDEMARWTSERDRETALRDEHMTIVKRVKGLQALQAQKAQLEEELGRLQKQLPAAAQMDGVLRGITAAGRVRGLQFELFRPAPVQLQDGYAEMPVALRVVGGYHDIGAFLGDLAGLPRIATLHNIMVMPPVQVLGGERGVTTGSRLLTMEATLRTYRALDPQEAAQVKRRQQKPADASGAQQSPAGSRSGTTAGGGR